MPTSARSYRAASADLAFRTMKGLAEAIEVVESQPVANGMQRAVHLNLLRNLRRAVERPGGFELARQLAPYFQSVADMLEDIGIEQRLVYRKRFFPQLDQLLARLAQA